MIPQNPRPPRASPNYPSPGTPQLRLCGETVRAHAEKLIPRTVKLKPHNISPVFRFSSHVKKLETHNEGQTLQRWVPITSAAVRQVKIYINTVGTP